MSHEVQTLNRVRHQQKQSRDLTGFNFSASAELFPSRVKKRANSVGYRRFNTAAEAVQCVVEDLAPEALLGACLEVNETRLTMDDIHQLYESDAYPLKRRKPKN
jgi:hypothetical protein